MYSLRRTLAVRLSATMFITLLLIGLWASLGTYRILRNQLDASLSELLAFESSQLPGLEGVESDLSKRLSSAAPHVINRYIVVRDSSGHVIGANTPVATSLPLDREAFTRALKGETVRRTEGWRGGPARTIYAPVPPNRGGWAVFQASAELRPLNHTLRQVLFFIGGTVLLGSLATLFGASWLAQRSTAPVYEITRQAEEIDAGRLSRRITSHADVAEFEGLVSVINRMLDRVERSYRAQQRIVRDVGHDIKTPLTVIRGEIEVALRGVREPERYKATLRSVLEESERLEMISSGLITLAKLENDSYEPAYQEVDVSHLVEDIVNTTRDRTSSHPVSVKAATNVSGVLDSGLVRTAVCELIQNSQQHTPPGTEISVGVEDRGERIEISVSDNGPGIPEEDLPYIFERFYRGDEARTRTAGAGLGLTLVQAIVLAHRGKIIAKPNPSAGITICMALPKTPAAPS